MSYRTDAQLATDNTGISTLGGVDATKIEKVELQVLVTNLIDSKRNTRDSERAWIDVTNNDIAIMVAGGTDNKTALQTLFDYLIDNGGGTLYFPVGKYDIDGALADTGNANAQVYFKQVDLPDQQISITLQGERKPPNQLFIASPVPSTGYSIIRSTLTGASGSAACIGSQRQSDSGLSEQNNVCVNVFDMIFEAPANPTFTMLDFRCLQSGTMDGVLVNSGNVNYTTVVQPTSDQSFGIKFPDYNHTPGTIVGSIDVWGFYNGVRLGELVIANAIRCWSCKVGLQVAGSYHGCVITNYIALQCPIGIQSNGDPAVLNIRYYDFEDANGTGQTWQEADWYLDDSGNDITGHITWDTIFAGIGRSNTFLQNGGDKVVVNRVGTMALPRYTPSGSTDNTHGGNFTVTADDTYLYYRTSSGTWKKIAWATF